jgi:hypothetical protein
MLSDGAILRAGRQEVLDEIGETLKKGGVSDWMFSVVTIVARGHN